MASSCISFLFVTISTWISIASNNTHKIRGLCGSDIQYDEWLSSSPPLSEYELIQTHVFIRHGDRLFNDGQMCWSADHYRLNDDILWECDLTRNIASSETNQQFRIKRLQNTQFFPGDCMVGQLTEIGYQQHINNGLGLRKRYINNYRLLPKCYDETKMKNIYLRSDDVHRTTHSAMGLFNGMYNVNKKQINPSIKVPLYTQDSETDIIMPNAHICPFLLDIMYQHHLPIPVVDPVEIFSLLTLMKEVLPLMNSTSELNFSISNLPEILDTLYFATDCATVHSCHGYEVPYNFAQTTYDGLWDALSSIYNLAFSDPYYKNVTMGMIGPVLKFTYERLEKMVSKSKGSVFYLTSGHDGGPIAPLLGAFNYTITDWIPYASLISIELYQQKSTNDYFVMISYNGEILKISCSLDTNYKMCQWNDFKEWIVSVIPSVDFCPGINGHSNTIEKKKKQFESKHIKSDKVHLENKENGYDIHELKRQTNGNDFVKMTVTLIFVLATLLVIGLMIIGTCFLYKRQSMRGKRREHVMARQDDNEEMCINKSNQQITLQ